MNKLLALLFGIIALNVNAQDTICVMVTPDELITFNYQTSEVVNRAAPQCLSSYFHPSQRHRGTLFAFVRRKEKV